METDPDGTQILMQLFILVLLTLVNAFFAGAEMAVVSVNKNRVKVLAEEGNKKALLIQSLFEDSTKFLSTIQVAITCADVYKRQVWKEPRFHLRVCENSIVTKTGCSTGLISLRWILEY